MAAAMAAVSAGLTAALITTSAVWATTEPSKSACLAALTCSDGPCHAHAACTDAPGGAGGAACSCRQGYLGDGRTCSRDKRCRQPTASSLEGARCDGEWTVVQTRLRGDVKFHDRARFAYRAGFGNLDGDYWSGLEALHELCPKDRPCALRVELFYRGPQCEELIRRTCVKRQKDGRYVAQYGRFAVAGNEDKFRLYISHFDATASTAGDCMTELNGQYFSDKDHDYEKSGKHCARDRGNSGWWFNAWCSWSNLNGIRGHNSYQGIMWQRINRGHSLQSSRMLVKVQSR